MDHIEIKALLERLGSTLEAAELHGLLCGLLGAMPSQRAKSRWFSELLESTSVEAGELARHATDLKALEEVFEATVDEINASDLSLQLLLPEDSESVRVRTEGLASWCTGYCLGVGLGTGWSDESVPDSAEKSASKPAGNTTARALPDDTLELLSDFTAISRAAAEDDENDEAALVELEEYVRMGALLIFEELQPASPAPTPDPTRVH